MRLPDPVEYYPKWRREHDERQERAEEAILDCICDAGDQGITIEDISIQLGFIQGEVNELVCKFLHRYPNNLKTSQTYDEVEERIVWSD